MTIEAKIINREGAFVFADGSFADKLLIETGGSMEAKLSFSTLKVQDWSEPDSWGKEGDGGHIQVTVGHKPGNLVDLEGDFTQSGFSENEEGNIIALGTIRKNGTVTLSIRDDKAVSVAEFKHT